MSLGQWQIKCLFTKGGDIRNCLVANRCLRTTCLSLVVGIQTFWETLSFGIGKHCRNIGSTFYRKKNSWRSLGSLSYSRERNTCQLHILLLAQCQISQTWLETNTECLLRCSEELLGNRDVYQGAHTNELSLPSNLPLILLLCCHCRSYCSKVTLWASVGSVSEAGRKKKTTQKQNPGIF